VTVHRVWTYLAANKGFGRRVMNFLSFIPTAVWRSMRLGRFDVVVATSPQFFCAWAGCLSGFLKRTPWVMEVRDLWPESIPVVGAMKESPVIRILRLAARGLYLHASGIVCLTRSFIEEISLSGIPVSRMAYVPNGIDSELWRSERGADERRAIGFRPDEIVVSYVGTLGMAHGLGTVLDAAAKLKEAVPQIRFLLVGDGSDRDVLERRIAEDNLSNVTLLGLVPRDRVPGLLAASDILLVSLKPSPMFEKVLPSKLFEAMAAGKPIVLSVGGEAKAVLDRARAGIAVEPGNAEAIAEAVTTLAADSERRQACGKAGQEFVAAEFSRDRWAAVMLSALQKFSRPAQERA
jgi:glycosyltransferase involved in cell wall biosynthesis